MVHTFAESSETSTTYDNALQRTLSINRREHVNHVHKSHLASKNNIYFLAMHNNFLVSDK